MADVYEIARYLGQLLKEEQVIKDLEAARDNYNKDPEVGDLMTEYGVLQQALADMYSSDDQDKKAADAINERINEIYEKIMKTDAYVKYEEAQDKVNDFMSKINSIIEMEIAGGNGGCTHDCSTCGGCH